MQSGCGLLWRFLDLWGLTLGSGLSLEDWLLKSGSTQLSFTSPYSPCNAWTSMRLSGPGLESLRQWAKINFHPSGFVTLSYFSERNEKLPNTPLHHLFSLLHGNTVPGFWLCPWLCSWMLPFPGMHAGRMGSSRRDARRKVRWWCLAVALQKQHMYPLFFHLRLFHHCAASNSKSFHQLWSQNKTNICALSPSWPWTANGLSYNRKWDSIFFKLLLFRTSLLDIFEHKYKRCMNFNILYLLNLAIYSFNRQYSV